MPFDDPDIELCFQSYPEPARSGLLQLRTLIYEEAARLPEIGRLQEVLRWGQPSYITPDIKAATPIRLGTHKNAQFAIYTHCQTKVISDYAMTFPNWDRLDGNRAVLFESVDQIEPMRLSSLIRSALTYHLP